VEGTRIMYVGVHEQPPGRNRREKGGSASGQRAASICSVKNSRVGLCYGEPSAQAPSNSPIRERELAAQREARAWREASSYHRSIHESRETPPSPAARSNVVRCASVKGLLRCPKL
jgi:hypothetical protein